MHGSGLESLSTYEKNKEIGGQFNFAKVIPGKEEFHETIRFYSTQLKKYKVNVVLQTQVTAEILGENFDKIVGATAQ